MKIAVVLLSIMLFAIVGLPSVAAIDENKPIYLGVYKQNSTVDLKLRCNLDDGLLCSSGFLCNATILYPDTSYLVNFQSMTRIGADYNITLPDSTILGVYNGMEVYCTNGTAGGTKSYFFKITKNGYEPANDTLTMFIYILFIIAMIGSVSTLILSIAKLATASETIFGVLTSWAFLTLMLFVNYLDRHYLLDSFIKGITDVMVTTMIWSNGIIPLIGLIVTMFVKGLQKKKPINAQQFIGRFPVNYG